MRKSAFVFTVLWALSLLACGGGSDSVVTVVEPNVKMSFSFGGVPADATKNVSLSWSSDGRCAASGAWSGDKSASGYEELALPGGEHVFKLTCYNGTAVAGKSLSVIIPDVYIRIPQAIASATLVPVEWWAYNTDSTTTACMASGDWAGHRSAFGAEKLQKAPGKYKFTMTCYREGVWRNFATAETLVAAATIEEIKLLRAHAVNPLVVDNPNYDQQTYAVTHRWDKDVITVSNPLSLSVPIYDGNAMLQGRMVLATQADIQAILDDWNLYLEGRNVVLTKDPNPDIALSVMDCVSQKCEARSTGDTAVWSANYGTDEDDGVFDGQAWIILNNWGVGISTQTFKEKLGRVLGFAYGFTNDGGVMAATNPGMNVGAATGVTVNILYRLPPKTYIGN